MRVLMTKSGCRGKVRSRRSDSVQAFRRETRQTRGKSSTKNWRRGGCRGRSGRGRHRVAATTCSQSSRVRQRTPVHRRRGERSAREKGRRVLQERPAKWACCSCDILPCSFHRSNRVRMVTKPSFSGPRTPCRARHWIPVPPVQAMSLLIVHSNRLGALKKRESMCQNRGDP